jgi:hypothetical protein
MPGPAQSVPIRQPSRHRAPSGTFWNFLRGGSQLGKVSGRRRTLGNAARRSVLDSDVAEDAALLVVRLRSTWWCRFRHNSPLNSCVLDQRALHDELRHGRRNRRRRSHSGRRRQLCRTGVPRKPVLRDIAPRPVRLPQAQDLVPLRHDRGAGRCSSGQDDANVGK